MANQYTDKGLTPKQEAFALKYVECNNASEAYREAYNVSDDTTDKVIWNEACIVSKHHDVTVRVQELRKRLEEQCIVNVVTHTKELDDLAQLAIKEKQLGVASTCYKNKGTMHGLYKDKETSGITIILSKEAENI